MIPPGTDTPANGFGISVSRTHGQTTVKTALGNWVDSAVIPLIWDFVEPMTGIEPAHSAWEVDSVCLLEFLAIRSGQALEADQALTCKDAATQVHESPQPFGNVWWRVSADL
jgi:hypothetical protein